MQFVITAEHPPNLCPTSNAATRNLMKQGAKELPGLAQKLGLKIITLNVFGGDHIVMAVVEAADIGAVRNFVAESRLIQWNTVKVNATMSMEEALALVDTLPPLF